MRPIPPPLRVAALGSARYSARVRSGAVVIAALAVGLGGCGLFASRQSMPIASTPGTVQEGIASWYGPGFHGRRTASGEIYDQYDLTAAHQTLPHGTYVRVQNLTNRRSVLVRINDRGPFVDDRIIDLSYAAAVELAMIGPGTAPVALEVVAPATVAATRAALPVPARPLPASNPTAPPIAPVAVSASERGDAARPPRRYAVQLGAFTDYAHARRLQRALAQRGTPARLGLVEEAGYRYYRLRVGPFGASDQAARAARELADLGFPALVVGTAAP